MGSPTIGYTHIWCRPHPLGPKCIHCLNVGPNLLPAAHLAHLPKGSWHLVGHQADELQGKMQEQHQEDIAKPSCFPMVRRPQEKVIFVLVTELPVSHNARLSRLSSQMGKGSMCLSDSGRLVLILQIHPFTHSRSTTQGVGNSLQICPRLPHACCERIPPCPCWTWKHCLLLHG